MYRWFCPLGGYILDPFAGESSKGIVATVLGHIYTGVELRREQIEANERQAKAVGVSPTWICGDAGKIGELLPKDVKYDMVFTSPPYYDLEIYSRKKEDGSAFSSYSKFREWYVSVFRQCVGRLKDNRFLVVKVGEIRDKRGAYRNFVGDNVTCFVRHCGMIYYNEIVLITAMGSLPIRVQRCFRKHRKIGKTHQNVLVFYKGDPGEIQNHFPELTYGND